MNFIERGSRTETRDPKAEEIIKRTEEDLILRGKKLDETASSIEKLRNPADGEEFKDFYDITLRSREIELCEKKEAWVCDSDAFLKEKTLRTLGNEKIRKGGEFI